MSITEEHREATQLVKVPVVVRTCDNAGCGNGYTGPNYLAKFPVGVDAQQFQTYTGQWFAVFAVREDSKQIDFCSRECLLAGMKAQP